MSRDDGDTVDVEPGDGKGNVQVPGTRYVWCQTVQDGRVLRLVWGSAAPVPPEGTHIIAQRVTGVLRFPPPDASAPTRPYPPTRRQAGRWQEST